MSLSSNGESCDVIQDLLAIFNKYESRPDTAASVICLSATCVCLVLCLLLNIYIAANIFYKKKFQIRYFTTFLLLLHVQLVYLALSIFSQLLELTPQCFPETQLTRDIASVSGPLTRAGLGVFGCLVGALTIERFLASTTAGPILRSFLNTLTLLLALAGPISVVTCFILIKFEVFEAVMELDTEFWFGVEICVYVIFPLLLLTVFGTVNCCKVSMSSRMLPTKQVQAIKINIAVTVSTNIAIFLFLVQESLNLWQRQLLDRQDDPGFHDEVQSALVTVALAEHVTTTLLSLMVSLVSLLYCAISSSCCHECCCPSINELEQIRYEQVDTKDVL